MSVSAYLQWALDYCCSINLFFFSFRLSVLSNLILFYPSCILYLDFALRLFYYSHVFLQDGMRGKGFEMERRAGSLPVTRRRSITAMWGPETYAYAIACSSLPQSKLRWDETGLVLSFSRRKRGGEILSLLSFYIYPGSKKGLTEMCMLINKCLRSVNMFKGKHFLPQFTHECMRSYIYIRIASHLKITFFWK